MERMRIIFVESLPEITVWIVQFETSGRDDFVFRQNVCTVMQANKPRLRMENVAFLLSHRNGCLHQCTVLHTTKKHQTSIDERIANCNLNRIEKSKCHLFQPFAAHGTCQYDNWIGLFLLQCTAHGLWRARNHSRALHLTNFTVMLIACAATKTVVAFNRVRAFAWIST